MKINEVEALVGITKKNIRFYEEQGLLKPGRNSQNGYREYGPGEVEQLKQISLDAGGLLREMEQMEQEGATFLDRQQGDTRRIRYVAPVVVTLLTVFLMGGLIALMLWGFSIDAEDAPPLPLLVVLVAIPGVVILGVLLAMIQRFREIEKGEAEDAKQY